MDFYLVRVGRKSTLMDKEKTISTINKTLNGKGRLYEEVVLSAFAVNKFKISHDGKTVTVHRVIK